MKAQFKANKNHFFAEFTFYLKVNNNLIVNFLELWSRVGLKAWLMCDLCLAYVCRAYNTTTSLRLSEWAVPPLKWWLIRDTH